MTPDERKAKRAQLTAYGAPGGFSITTAEYMSLLDALDAAERRAAEAEGDTALLRAWGNAGVEYHLSNSTENGGAMAKAHSALTKRAHALANEERALAREARPGGAPPQNERKARMVALGLCGECEQERVRGECACPVEDGE